MSLLDKIEPQSPSPVVPVIDGKWLVLIEDEEFDREHNVVLEIQGATAVDNRGGSGEVQFLENRILIDLNRTYDGGGLYNARYVLTGLCEDAASLSGLIYQAGATIPAGDPGRLYEEQRDTDDSDEDNLPVCDTVFLYRDELAEEFFGAPSKFSVIDVSMYDFEHQIASGFRAASTDEEIEAALKMMPLATATLKSGESWSAGELED